MFLCYRRRLSAGHQLSFLLHLETLADPCHLHRWKVVLDTVAIFEGCLSRTLLLAISVRLGQVLRQGSRGIHSIVPLQQPEMFPTKLSTTCSTLTKRQDVFDGTGTSQINETLRFVVEHPAQKAWVMRLEIAYGLAYTHLRTMLGIGAHYSDFCPAHTHKDIVLFCKLQERLCFQRRCIPGMAYDEFLDGCLEFLATYESGIIAIQIYSDVMMKVEAAKAPDQHLGAPHVRISMRRLLLILKVLQFSLRLHSLRHDSPLMPSPPLYEPMSSKTNEGHAALCYCFGPCDGQTLHLLTDHVHCKEAASHAKNTGQEAAGRGHRDYASLVPSALAKSDLAKRRS